MSNTGHQIEIDMSTLVAKASERADAEPEAFVVICLRQQFRRLQISSEGVLSGVGYVNLEPVNARFCCSLYHLEMPEMSRLCFGEMVSFLDVDPQIHDSLVAEMASKVFEIAGRALEAGVRRLDISADVRVVETSLFGYEEEGAAWASRESLDLAETRRFRAQPASTTSIQSLMRCKYGRRHSDQRTCTICLCEFSFRSCIMQMPCSHIFHHGCIARWLQQSNACPLCRFELPL